MGDQLDRLFQDWHRLGGAVLLAEEVPDAPARSAEAVIAESTAHCRESGRLTWVVLDWLIHNIDQLEDKRLLRMTGQSGDLSVLGLLCDAARQRRPHPKFDRIIAVCKPNAQIELFFARVARSPLAARLARDNALDIFRRWNYLSNELHYL